MLRVVNDSIESIGATQLKYIRPVSALLLDFQMPIKNGVQVVQEIKSFYK